MSSSDFNKATGTSTSATSQAGIPNAESTSKTAAQKLAEYQSLSDFSSSYLTDKPSNDDEATASDVSPKSMPPPKTKAGTGKRKSTAKNPTAGAVDSMGGLDFAPVNDHLASGPGKGKTPKLKKPAANPEPVRRSPRERKEKRKFGAVDEPESPLKKKNKRDGEDLAESTASNAADGDRETSGADSESNASATSKAEAPDDALPKTRPASNTKRQSAKTSKKHTPSSDSAKKQAGGRTSKAPANKSKANQHATASASNTTRATTTSTAQDGGTDGPADEQTPRRSQRSNKGKGKAQTTDADDGKQTEKSKKTDSKKYEKVIPDGYVGQDTGLGGSSNPPKNTGQPVLAEPWHCANRRCTTGMTWFKRDGSGQQGFGRKTVSNFFGRNKKETGYIDLDVCHMYCRKCYQRGKYKYTDQSHDDGDFYRKPEEGTAQWHMNNLRIQLTRLKLWRPQATFKVQLTKAMLERSNEYHALLRKHNNDADAAKLEYKKQYPIKKRSNKKAEKSKKSKNQDSDDITDDSKMKLEESFHPELVDAFIRDHCGSDIDYDGVDQILDHIQSMRDADTIKSLPPIEFLISPVKPGETVNSARDNYKQWLAFEDGRRPSTDDGNQGGSSDKGAAPSDDERSDGNGLLGHFDDTSKAREADAEESDAEAEDDDDDDDEEDPAAPPPFKLNRPRVYTQRDIEAAQELFALRHQHTGWIAANQASTSTRFEAVGAGQKRTHDDYEEDSQDGDEGEADEDGEYDEDNVWVPPITGKKPRI